MPAGLLRQRCDPYGFGTDRGPRHLMGGLFGPEYAGRDLVLEDGMHGIGICENPAAGRYVMRCPAGHAGREMWLCYNHVRMITKRMSATCTACVMPPESRQLWEDQRVQEEYLRRALAARDTRAALQIKARIEDIGRQQVQLTRRGLTPRRPMQLVEVSLCGVARVCRSSALTGVWWLSTSPSAAATASRTPAVS